MSTAVYSDTEVAAALAHLGKLDEKQLRAKKGSWIAFMKQCPDEVARLSKGPERMKLLAKFHLHQAAAQNAQKNVKSQKEIENKVENIRTVRWMSIEQMKLVFGDMKSQHWVDSKILVVRPDRVTKSCDELYIEYACYDDMEKITDADIRRLRAQAESEMTEEDFKLLEKAFGNGIVPLSESITADLAELAAAETTEEKKEEPEVILAKKMDWLKTNIEPQHKRCLEMITWAKIIQTKAHKMGDAKQRHLGPLHADLDYVIKEATRFSNILVDMQTLEVKQTKYPKIIMLKEEIDRRFIDADEAATRWSLEASSSVGGNEDGNTKAKRRKKKSASGEV